MFSLRRFITPACCSSSSKVLLQQQQTLASTALLGSALSMNALRMQSSNANTNTNQQRRPNNNNNNRNNNNRNNNNNNNNNMRRNNNNNNMQMHNQNATRTLGAVEFFDVQEDPKEGREMRCSFRHDMARDNRIMTITIRPQIGPRKTDPNDPNPQFDQANRLTIRIRPMECATLLRWLSGRQSKDDKSVEISGASYKVALSEESTGLTRLVLTGTKLDGTPSEPLDYKLQPHQVIQFREFLDNSLYAFWGIPSF